MGDAYKCDRCQSLVAGWSPVRLDQDYTGTKYMVFGRDNVELCEDCVFSLQDWWDDAGDDKTVEDFRSDLEEN